MIKEFNGWNKIDLAYKKLLYQLPGTKKLKINISSTTPEQIIQLLQGLDYDTILLTNSDVWRYSDNHQLLSFFSDRPHQQFFIQHLGYHNSKPLPNTWELSFNGFYFSRIITQFNLKSSDALGVGCLNRTPRFHRTWLAYQLWSNQVLDNVVFSIQDITENTDHLRKKLESQPNWSEFQKVIPIRWPNTDSGDINDHSVNHIAYTTFSNIVTESETECVGYDNTAHATPVITEKTWKPFLSCQIPIFYTAQGQLEYLNSLGFEMFEDILPPGYDSMGTVDKAQAIVDIVAKGRDWIADIYFTNLHKIRHNHELVVGDQVEKSMVDRAIDFVYNR